MRFGIDVRRLFTFWVLRTVTGRRAVASGARERGALLAESLLWYVKLETGGPMEDALAFETCAGLCTVSRADERESSLSVRGTLQASAYRLRYEAPPAASYLALKILFSTRLPAARTCRRPSELAGCKVATAVRGTIAAAQPGCWRQEGSSATWSWRMGTPRRGNRGVMLLVGSIS